MLDQVFHAAIQCDRIQCSIVAAHSAPFASIPGICLVLCGLCNVNCDTLFFTSCFIDSVFFAPYYLNELTFQSGNDIILPSDSDCRQGAAWFRLCIRDGQTECVYSGRICGKPDIRKATAANIRRYSL